MFPHISPLQRRLGFKFQLLPETDGFLICTSSSNLKRVRGPRQRSLYSDPIRAGWSGD